MELKQRESNLFDCMQREELRHGKIISFNSCVVCRICDDYTMTQGQHIIQLSIVDEGTLIKSEYNNQKARGAYKAAICGPDLSYGFPVACQATDTDKATTRLLNRYIRLFNNFPKGDLQFSTLDRKSLRLAVLVVAGFATNLVYSSQVGFAVAVMNTSGTSRII